MKKTAAVAIVMLILAGCVNKEVKDVFVTPVSTPDVTETKFLYNPGTYRGEANGYNGSIVVEVTVSDSKILSIEIVSHNESDYEIPVTQEVTEPEDPENPEDEPKEEPGEEPLPEELTEFVEVLGPMDSIKNIVLSEQTVAVDTISGATVSTKALLDAILRALNAASL
ncbi:MAG: FMN-binding protein [Erysipelotrichaceae bacterium]|nr:FMN-binding protein [Erysipelotrichaceae bacterium]